MLTSETWTKLLKFAAGIVVEMRGTIRLEKPSIGLVAARERMKQADTFG